MHAPLPGPIIRAEAVAGIAAIGALPIMPQTTPAPPSRVLNEGREYTAIVGSTVLAGDNLEAIPNGTVLLRGNRIEAVGRHDAVAIPAGAHRLNAHGMFTSPGLIDAHVHFFQSGGLYTRPDAIDLRTVRPYTEELEWIKNNVYDTFGRYLRAGITTVVDAGGPFWNYNVRADAAKTPAAPRVFVAGPLISSVDRSILDPHGDPPIVKIDTAQAARELIDRELNSNTDYVKFWWVVTPDIPVEAFAPVARDAIDYAHQKGARVIVHATELETARAAVECGADILAHSVFDTDVDDAFVQLLRAQDIIYCPTLLVPGNYGYTFHGRPNLTATDLRWANPEVVATLFHMPDVENELPAKTLEAIRARRVPEPPHAAMRNLKRLHDAGVRIAAGTDAGNIGTQHASSLYAEAVAMVDSGLSPQAVFVTMTQGGAALAGRGDLGVLAPGNLGDVALFERNPLSDIRAIDSVRYVLKDGHLFEPEALVARSPESVVQQQVNAYNFHDIGVFAELYTPTARVSRNGKVIAASRAEIAAYYGERFSQNGALHAEIISRSASGNEVVDRERVSGLSGAQMLEATVRYRVEGGLIVEASIEA